MRLTTHTQGGYNFLKNPRTRCHKNKLRIQKKKKKNLSKLEYVYRPTTHAQGSYNFLKNLKKKIKIQCV
jgi:hypothetical protein